MCIKSPGCSPGVKIARSHLGREGRGRRGLNNLGNKVWRLGDSPSVLFEVDDQFCVIDQLQRYAAGVVGTECEDVG